MYANAAFAKIPVLDILSMKKMSNIWLLNKLGAQPFRIWLAEKRYKLRGRKVSDEIRPYIDELDREGIVVISDFFPQEEFELLEKQCYEALDEGFRDMKRQDGPNVISSIGRNNLEKYARIAAALDNKKVLEIFCAAERRQFSTNQYTRSMHCLEQGADNGTVDPETMLHEDTFFNTHKAWLYITDVTFDNAPFVFVKGSHRNDVTKRKGKSYKYTLSKERVQSRRISTEELNELGLEETSYTATKNTLVIANTLGFHRRLRGIDGHRRIALDYSARFNPFI